MCIPWCPFNGQLDTLLCTNSTAHTIKNVCPFCDWTPIIFQGRLVCLYPLKNHIVSYPIPGMFLETNSNEDILFKTWNRPSKKGPRVVLVILGHAPCGPSVSSNISYLCPSPCVRRSYPVAEACMRTPLQIMTPDSCSVNKIIPFAKFPKNLENIQTRII